MTSDSFPRQQRNATTCGPPDILQPPTSRVHSPTPIGTASGNATLIASRGMPILMILGHRTSSLAIRGRSLRLTTLGMKGWLTECNVGVRIAGVFPALRPLKCQPLPLVRVLHATRPEFHSAWLSRTSVAELVHLACSGP